MSFLIHGTSRIPVPDEFGDARRRRITVRRQLFDFTYGNSSILAITAIAMAVKTRSLTGIKDIQILSHKEDCKIRYPSVLHAC